MLELKSKVRLLEDQLIHLRHGAQAAVTAVAGRSEAKLHRDES